MDKYNNLNDNSLILTPYEKQRLHENSRESPEERSLSSVDYCLPEDDVEDDDIFDDMYFSFSHCFF